MLKDYELKNKKFLYLYFAALAVVGLVALIILLTVNNYNTAVIVNTVCLGLTPVIFFLGYLDFKNYLPLSKRLRAAYIALGMVTLTICLTHFNVQNYNYLETVSDENYSRPITSIFAAASLAISFFSIILIFIHREEKHLQARLFYATAIASLLSSTMLVIFNFGTTVVLFDGVLWLFYREGFVVDTGLIILMLRVVFEFLLFNVNALKEKKKGTSGNEESEYHSAVVTKTRIALAFLVANVVLLPFINMLSSRFVAAADALYIVYEVVEAVNIVALVVLGTLLIVDCKKSSRYGQIYKRMGVAAIIYAAVYLIMDFFPIALIAKPETVLHSMVINEVFHACVKIAGLLSYTLYLMLNKKLNNQIRMLEDERLFRDNVI